MNKNKMLTSVMCATTLMTSVLPVFATQTLTNDTLSNLEDTEVLYSKSATYMVTIPKQIILGTDKTASYSVKVEGDISSDQEVYVAPVDAISETETIDFYMEDQSTSALKKDAVETTVTPTKTVWNFAEVASATEVTDNKIESLKLTSGTWKGVFNFEINLKTLGEDEVIALEAGLYDANGVMLCTWEESGIDVEMDYTIFTYGTNTATPYYVLKNNYPNTTTIVIPDSVTSIGAYTFISCKSLTSITIPDSVTSISSSAFNRCTNLTSITIPDSVTSIGYGAFDGCTSLTSITIPDSVTSISNSAFSNCTNLTSITINENNTVYDSRNNCNAIIETSTNTLVAGCQNTTIPNSVTSIGDYAFRGCTNLTSITIPDSVTSIGYSAFYGCENLTNITIPNSVTSIGDYAFYDCADLTSITIPDSVTSIGEFAFSNCTNLTSITIPDSVTSIGKDAFRGCTNLTSITIPDSVTSIGYGAFNGCTSLTSITIPDSVTSIGDYAFDGCESLTTVNYTGTEEQWNTISISSHGNTYLTNAKINYNYVAE